MEKNQIKREEAINSELFKGLEPNGEDMPTINLITPPDDKLPVKERESMVWQIKIEGKPKQKIIVQFDPLKETVIFSGLYNIKGKWIVFSEEEYSMNITLEIIKEKLFNVYEKMNDRLKVHEDLNKSFNVINLIGVVE